MQYLGNCAVAVLDVEVLANPQSSEVLAMANAQYSHARRYQGQFTVRPWRISCSEEYEFVHNFVVHDLDGVMLDEDPRCRGNKSLCVGCAPVQAGGRVVAGSLFAM